MTVGGGLRYIVPAWINIHQLRHLGCKLPIEMWYPLAEYPTQPVIDAFARLGVTTLDFQVRLHASTNDVIQQQGCWHLGSCVPAEEAESTAPTSKPCLIACPISDMINPLRGLWGQCCVTIWQMVHSIATTTASLMS